MKQTFSAIVRKEGAWYVAQALEADVASQGATTADALANLREALELHFTPPVAGAAPQIRQVEVEVAAG
ncbi:MAG: type II toxin-antitoxin system HicB family antitoxin [Chloroflexota bacterium]|nr:type II toxin-antitoxin system HicB family antitoxin [Chloroflexota bacterium]